MKKLNKSKHLGYTAPQTEINVFSCWFLFENVDPCLEKGLSLNLNTITTYHVSAVD
jgi:hypothetical protein